jgi:hypothetical protein
MGPREWFVSAGWTWQSQGGGSSSGRCKARPKTNKWG